jgi:hypothetical protein
MQYIQSIPDWDSKTAEECRDYLLEITNLPPNRTLYTWSGISEQLLVVGVPPEAIIAFIDNVESVVGGKALDKMLSSGGIDFSGEAIRNQIMFAISQLAAEQVVANLVLSGMLSIGIGQAPNWQRLGLDSEPTLEQVETDLANFTESVRTEQVWQSAYNQFISPVLDSEFPTVEALTAGVKLAGEHMESL